jgi:hypothetical protein
VKRRESKEANRKRRNLELRKEESVKRKKSPRKCLFDSLWRMKNRKFERKSIRAKEFDKNM